MGDWEVFHALCTQLRTGLLPGGPVNSATPVSWHRLIEVGKTHFVTPALSWCARHDPEVSVELRSYLDAVLRLNGKRNERLADTLEHVIGALNAIDIEPTLLKGAAHLVGELYPTSAARLMSDLDILIPQERGQDAVAAMKDIGFYVDQALSESHHHLPQMRHTETNLIVELHTRLLQMSADPLVPVSWVRERLRPIAFRNLQVRVPDPTVLIAHNVAHDQIVHENFKWSQVELRQLLDLALIRMRHENQIDWAELDRRFGGFGLGRLLATYLRYDEVLFGQPMPAISSAPRVRAIARLRRVMDKTPVQRQARRVRRQRREILAALPKSFIASRFRSRRDFLRLFKPRAWVRQFREIRRALKEVS